MSEFDVENLRRIRVEPGDIFVLTLARDVSAAEAQGIRDNWRERFGSDVPLLLLSGGAQLSVLNTAAPARPVIEHGGA